MLLGGLSWLLMSGVAPQVSAASLLPQVADLEWLTRRPTPAFAMAQASSYDRRSNPGPNQDWFANGDAGQFVRTEQTNGRSEDVMADLHGPGAVVRMWSANPSGTVRFYFDGETTPRIQCPMTDWFSGKIAPVLAPFAYTAAQGFDAYYPFPYANSLKITVEGSKGLYYHVGYRTYAPGTTVETWDKSHQAEELAAVKQLTRFPLDERPLPAHTHLHRFTKDISPSKSLSVDIKGTQAITEFTVSSKAWAQDDEAKPWTDPSRAAQILRHLLLKVSFDGEPCIEAPLGDFFCTAPGVNPLKTMPFTVKADGTLTCRFVMPFEHSAQVAIENDDSVNVPVTLRLVTSPYRWDKTSYHLHSQWLSDQGHTRPLVDMNLLKVQGEGLWVGCNLHIANPTSAWWGEGDEKVYVDGEAFPSTFGTGTEDFFGYAWSSAQLFNKFYHAQSRCDGPNNYGHSFVCRFQIFDPIPFRTSLRFDLEKWHWQDVVANYDHTAYWYASPHSWGSQPTDLSKLDLPYYEVYRAPKGVIEGESLSIVSVTGGKTQVQDGFPTLSGGKQLWWTNPDAGDKLTLLVPVKKAGKYEALIGAGHAVDYGTFKIGFAGKTSEPIDFYSPSLFWKSMSLGTLELMEGNATLQIECTGSNPAAVKARMFGLDYVYLKPVP